MRSPELPFNTSMEKMVVSPEGQSVPEQTSRRTFLSRVVVGSVAMAALPLLPEAASADSYMPSSADQKRLGHDAEAQILKRYPEVRDARAATFQRIGQRMINALPPAERTAWDYAFHVIENPMVNAFALPGGPMLLLTGLLNNLSPSDDEIAAVTGHELTHVRRQHWANMKAQQERHKSLISRGLGKLHLPQRWGSAATIMDNFLFGLPYSRREEDEADAMGLQNMVDAGFNPQGMVDLFVKMQRMHGNREVMKYLNNHPPIADRIQRTRDRIKRLKR